MFVPSQAILDHEQLVVRRGRRSGLTIAVAIHSSALGPALGGARMRHYPDWRDGVADALRLAEGMTYKCAVAGLDHGGAKAVVVLPTTAAPDAGERRAALLDLGDVVESFGGAFTTGPDIGTGPLDMVTIAERTSHVCCRPAGYGGSGDSSTPTARGVLAAIRATLGHRFDVPDPRGRRITLIGLGSVGALVAAELAAAGARLLVTDVDPAKRALAGSLGATWSEPAAALTAPADLLVPAAVGGLLTPESVPGLRSDAIVGPANNQLSAEPVADLLHARGIVWVPDYVVGAGGVVHAATVELHGGSGAAALAAVDRIGDTVSDLLKVADRDGVPAQRAARTLADARLAAADRT
jgi:leucine dehydrogenase